jgi:hypothetical protein
MTFAGQQWASILGPSLTTITLGDEMRKTLIIAIALSLVLLSGGLFSAHANCAAPSACNMNLSFLSPCNWHFPSFSSCRCASREDRASAAARGGYYFGQMTPASMDSTGF